jgi:hypothetical protein
MVCDCVVIGWDFVIECYWMLVFWRRRSKSECFFRSTVDVGVYVWMSMYVVYGDLYDEYLNLVVCVCVYFLVV